MIENNTDHENRVIELTDDQLDRASGGAFFQPVLDANTRANGPSVSPEYYDLREIGCTPWVPCA
jgi:hypothetical protein